jgi:hypothetical protein
MCFCCGNGPGYIQGTKMNDNFRKLNPLNKISKPLNVTGGLVAVGFTGYEINQIYKSDSSIIAKHAKAGTTVIINTATFATTAASLGVVSSTLSPVTSFAIGSGVSFAIGTLGEGIKWGIHEGINYIDAHFSN